MDKNKIIIVNSAHIGEARENIGDILSAKALAILIRKANSKIIYLPRDIGRSSNARVIYGGGGMIRPGFAKREVFKDLESRNKNIPYSIYGVGINVDNFSPDYSTKDKQAIKKWLAGADSVTVRDLETKKFISKLLKKPCQVAPCPSYQIVKKISKKIKPKYDIGIVLSLGHTASYKKYLKKIITLVSDLIRLSGNSRIILICHDKADYFAAKKLFPKTQAVFPKSFIKVNDTYRQCRGIITLRAHGIIFSAACNLPCSAVALNAKIGSLYHYHYGSPLSRKTDFNASAHLNFLKKKRLPISK